jgi:hypothetical protein
LVPSEQRHHPCGGGHGEHTLVIMKGEKGRIGEDVVPLINTRLLLVNIIMIIKLSEWSFCSWCIRLVEVLIGAQTLGIGDIRFAETLIGQVTSIRCLVGAFPIGNTLVAVLRLPTSMADAEIVLASIAFSTDTIDALRANMGWH